MVGKESLVYLMENRLLSATSCPLLVSALWQAIHKTF
ncbi:hypothetical protein [Sideroxydans sp. CL21]|nr:hypothetical protein [Sideroxydans sp. CL21]